jgi:hypothetical protein
MRITIDVNEDRPSSGPAAARTVVLGTSAAEEAYDGGAAGGIGAETPGPAGRVSAVSGVEVRDGGAAPGSKPRTVEDEAAGRAAGPGFGGEHQALHGRPARAARPRGRSRRGSARGKSD